jgi:hypothetical protein
MLRIIILDKNNRTDAYMPTILTNFVYDLKKVDDNQKNLMCKKHRYKMIEKQNRLEY